MKIKTEKVKKLFFLSLFLFPALSFGADGTAPLQVIANKILGFLKLFPPLFFALAFAYFMYGMLQYIMVADEKKMKEARLTIFYGIIGLFVMTAVWGLIAGIMSFFGLSK